MQTDSKTASIIRRMYSDKELLNDALSASRKDNPPMKVIVDHLERVIESMDKTIAKIKEAHCGN